MNHSSAADLAAPLLPSPRPAIIDVGVELAGASDPAHDHHPDNPFSFLGAAPLSLPPHTPVDHFRNDTPNIEGVYVWAKIVLCLPIVVVLLGDQVFFGGLEGSAKPHAPVEVWGHVDYSDLLQMRAILLRILEASKSTAKATAQVTVVAKALAMDKATVATRVVAAAKKALELVVSFEEKYDQTEDLLVNNKMEKHVPVKLLYKRQKLFHVNDEELARKLHHIMNSSPRISKNSVKLNQTPDRSRKLKATPMPNKTLVCESDLSSSCVNEVEGEFISSTAVCEIGKLDDKAPTISRVLEIKNGRKHSLKKQRLKYEVGRVSNGKKIKFKQKKLLLSLCNCRDSEKVRSQPNSLGTHDPEIKQKEKDSSPLDAKLPKECCQPVENIQMRTGGEFVAPNFFVERKMLESRGPNPAVTTASAMIKVDQ